jgi:hypothetical protein
MTAWRSAAQHSTAQHSTACWPPDECASEQSGAGVGGVSGVSARTGASVSSQARRPAWHSASSPPQLPREGALLSAPSNTVTRSCSRAPFISSQSDRSDGCLSVTPLHYTALHYTALHCAALHCAALHCAALHCAALHCAARQKLWAALITQLYCAVLCAVCCVLCCAVLCCAIMSCPVLCLLYCTVMHCPAWEVWGGRMRTCWSYTSHRVNVSRMR